MYDVRITRLAACVITCVLGAGAFAEAAEPPAPDATLAAVEQALKQASETRADGGQPLCPADLTVDQIEWEGNRLHVYLTLPAGGPEWRISDLDATAFSRALGSPFLANPAFEGTIVRVRVGRDRPYDSLQAFLPGGSPSAAQPRPPAPSQETAPVEPVSTVAPQGERGLGGATVQAARQPIGALTGVTVFVNAGHGWTADDNNNDPDTWFLQRPGDLWDMNEDHGNLDQLNYFVHYAFNAGATVVPFRPVGWQPIEIVLDNDDAAVTYTGAWSTNTTNPKYYGTNASDRYRFATAATTESATAVYTPTITVTGFYPVYCFAIASDNRTLQTYRIKHSGGISEVAVDHRLVGNGWVWLGNYYLEAGGDNYVKITNESPDAGNVIADAIRWGSGMGDIARGSGAGNMISGYARDEECARYWAHSELGNNATGFSASSIWDSSTSDQNDNVRTAAHWAREMNQEPSDLTVDRWKRIYLEFHTNAFNGSARGQITLITDLGATMYQEEYAVILADEVDADMLTLDSEFEHSWVDRASPTYTSSYGAICTPANGDEFDATIVELAFHDNQQDAELLRDCRVRSAMAKSCVQGIVRFLNTLSGSQVPLAFAPDTPRKVRAIDAGGGDVVLSWTVPLSDQARGDPATGYVIYQSGNGYGFGDPITTNGLSVTLSGLPVGETRYYRIAATNDGGESMPSEVLAVRRPAEGTAPVLIVNGFDQLRRQQNYVQEFLFPPAYAGMTPERQTWRRSNSYDYTVQHAEALAAAGAAFSTCADESVNEGDILLADYHTVVWISGEQRTEAELTPNTGGPTLTATEQTLLSTFLTNGGGLFLSGAEIAYDLDDQANGRTFYENTVKANFIGDDADTYTATGAGGILGGIGTFDFDPANGAPYNVNSPDQIAPQPGAEAILSYVGGAGGTAGVQYDQNKVYRVVTFGFPFETISSATTRADIMQEIMGFLEEVKGPPPCDYDLDGDVDLSDYAVFSFCFQGPTYAFPPYHLCLVMDGDEDNDVDLDDFGVCQQEFTGEL
ncbi:MAG: N-acetylmuramoyl-L-alanine amidase [Phycisphaerales bacterium]|nr:MAG: N-acetylmuramoyl-L-alanine amidase [Phycisphaerales bacterium]